MPKYPNSNKYNNKNFELITDENQNGSETYLYLNHFFETSKLRVESSENYGSNIKIYLKSSECYGVCPYCKSVSHKVHSTYIRTLTDLPIIGNRVFLYLNARKFFCKNTACPKKTFAEQPGDEICRYRRRTTRCETTISNLGLRMSAVSTSLVLKMMNIPVSSSTALRTIYRIPLPDVGKVTELGVDDWAFRKGLVYGSILVDLKKGNVIDLLADRETESFEYWIKEHAEVQYVSRDRSTNYSSAIANSGREIVEIADRFHLIKNMSDCVTKVISEYYSDYRNLICPDERLAVQEDEHIPPERLQRISLAPDVKSDAITNMFNEVKELQNKGLKIKAIAKKLNIARQTVRKYMNYDTFPKRRSSVRNEYYKYDKYVEEEYSKDKSLNDIYNEIIIKGFKGGRTPFYDHYQYLIQTRLKCTGKKKKQNIVDHREPLVPVKAISAIIFKNIHGYNLENEDKNLIDKLTELKWFKSLYKAAESFCKIIMGENAEALKIWIEEYKNTTIPKLKTFITGIIIDLKAVKNSIIYQLSNGIVEGFVNKLKTIKRMMYGRAGLELLKRKMILTNRGFQLN